MDNTKDSIPGFLRLVRSQQVVQRALRTSLVVGTILNLINNPGLWMAFSLDGMAIWQVGLTYLVPYLVSSHSSVQSMRHAA